jgi:hypothetical protein
MAQQTAVEYLLQKLYTEYRFAFSGTIVDKAKAIEKEQIIDFASELSYGIGVTKDEMKKVAEQYYNKIYNK